MKYNPICTAGATSTALSAVVAVPAIATPVTLPNPMRCIDAEFRVRAHGGSLAAAPEGDAWAPAPIEAMWVQADDDFSALVSSILSVGALVDFLPAIGAFEVRVAQLALLHPYALSDALSAFGCGEPIDLTLRTAPRFLRLLAAAHVLARPA